MLPIGTCGGATTLRPYANWHCAIYWHHTIRGKCHMLLENHPLAPYTSWKVGGPAERLYIPQNIDDLSHFLQNLPPTEPITWLGSATNVLVRDTGISGTVILIQDTLQDLRILEGGQVYAEAGLLTARLGRRVAQAGHTGAEFLAGIPGSVGGALAMNAGAYGSETWDYVDKVIVINRAGRRFERPKSDYAISYRQVEVPEQEWFVAAHFAFPSGDAEQALECMRDMLARRARSQPLEWPNAGSVFRNPPGAYAATLIESAGLKGYRIGGAMVSPKHANFIVNDARATATDIERLISHVQKVVAQKHGVDLVCEVKILGDV